MNTPELGSISTGTLRPQDLLVAFLYELRKYKPADANTENGLVEAICYKLNGDDDSFHEVLSETIEGLMDQLNEIAPEGMYFGANEGDGADFGFWKEE